MDLEDVRRYQVILDQVRREATTIREANERLHILRTQLAHINHPESAEIIRETAIAIHVALGYLKEVCWDF